MKVKTIFFSRRLKQFDGLTGDPDTSYFMTSTPRLTDKHTKAKTNVIGGDKLGGGLLVRLKFYTVDSYWIFCTDGTTSGCPPNHYFGKSYWMAGQRIDPQEETEFVWKVSLSNVTIIQQSMDFRYFIVRQPDFGQSASCLTMCPEEEYKWNDDRCSNNYCSICEIQPY